MAVSELERRIQPANNTTHLFNFLLMNTVSGAQGGLENYSMVEGNKLEITSASFTEAVGQSGTDPAVRPGAIRSKWIWGDGSLPEPVNRKFVPVSPHNWGFLDKGSHIYKTARSTPYELRLDVRGPTNIHPVAFGGVDQPYENGHGWDNIYVNVTDAPIHASGITLTTVENQPLDSFLGTFYDENPYGFLQEFTGTYTFDEVDHNAVIDGPGGRTPYTVDAQGQLWYYRFGDKAIPFTINSVNGSQTQSTTYVKVKDAALHAFANDPPIIDEPNEPLPPDFVVGWFTDENRNDKEDINDYTVTIDWGDGSVSYASAGSGLEYDGNGKYLIKVPHTYANEGDYTVKIHVVSIGGSEAWATSKTYRVPPPRGTVRVLGVGSYPGSHVNTIVEAGAETNMGALRLRHDLDFDNSPGTSVGRNPALVYNSTTVNYRPIVWASYRLDDDYSGTARLSATVKIGNTVVGSDSYMDVPLYPSTGTTDEFWFAIQITPPQPAQTDMYDVEVDVSVIYRYEYNNWEVKDTSDTFSAIFVSTDDSPFGKGWLLDGLDRIVEIVDGDDEGAIWVLPSGQSYYFRRNSGLPSQGIYDFITPPGMYGRLRKEENGFVYESEHKVESLFDINGRLTEVIDPHNLTVTYTYDMSGYGPVKVETPDGGVTTLVYSGGRLTSIQQPGDRLLTLANNGTLQSITDVDDTVRTFSYNSSDLIIGDQWGKIDADFEYGTAAEGGRLKQLEFTDESIFQLLPRDVRMLDRIVRKENVGQYNYSVWTEPIVGSSQIGFDERLWGHRTELHTPDEFSQYWEIDNTLIASYTDKLSRTTRYWYNDDGKITEIYFPDSTRRTYSYSNNSYNLVDTETDENGIATNYTYNSFGDLISIQKGTLQPVSYGYESTGLMTSYTNGNGKTTTYTYDASRRLNTVRDPLNRVVTYTYDSAGNISTSTNNDSVTITKYDGRNRLIELTIEPIVFDPTLPINRVLYAYDATGNRTSTTNQREVVTKEEYDPRLLLTKVIEAYSRLEETVTRYEYDGKLRLTKTIDALLHDSEIAYDNSDNQIKVTNQLDKFKLMEYDPVGNVIRVQDEVLVGSQLAYSFEYDLRNRQTKATNPLGAITRTEYDGVGNPTKVIDPVQSRTEYRYDAANRLVKTIDHFLADEETRYDGDGNVTKTIDKRDKETTYEYDAASQRTKIIAPDNGVTSFEYDLSGRQIKVVYPQTGNAEVRKYNPFGWVTMVGDLLRDRTQMFYDAAGNLTSTKDPQQPDETLYHYDALNRVTEVIAPLSGTVTTTYDQVGRTSIVTSPAPHGSNVAVIATEYRYDAAGRLTATVDAANNTTTHAYDDAGRLIRTTDRRNKDWTFEYDLAGRQTVARDPYGHGTVSYLDDAGYVTLTIDGNFNSVNYYRDKLHRVVETFDSDGRGSSYRYDAAGNVTLEFDRRGVTTAYAYDDMNRQTAVSNGTGEWKTEYNQAGRVTLTGDPTAVETSWLFDLIGRLTNINRDESGVETYQHNQFDVVTNQSDDGVDEELVYDILEREIARIVVSADGNLVTTKEYDQTGSLKKVISPEGQTESFYDRMGRLTKMVDPTGNHFWEYDAEGNLLREWEPSGRLKSYGYDDAGRQTASGWLDLNFSSVEATIKHFDPVGNVTFIEDMVGPVVTYQYDAGGRVVSEQRPLGTGKTYGYDLSGNLVATLDNAGRGTFASFDLQNRQIATQPVSGSEEEVAFTWYDEAGRVTAATDGSGVLTEYGYDANGRQTSVSVGGQLVSSTQFDDHGRVTKVLDALGRPTNYVFDDRGNQKSVTTPDGVQTIRTYDSANRVATVSVGGSVTTYQYDVAGRATKVISPNAQTTFQGYDHDGRLTLIQDGLGPTNVNMTAYFYDLAGRQTGMTYSSNIGGGGGGDTSTETAYRTDGLVDWMVDRSGRTHLFEYDDARRLIRHTVGGSVLVEYAYDQSGLQTAVTNSSGTVARKFDYHGWVYQETQPNGYQVNIQYDSAGRVLHWFDSNGGEVASSYDAKGLLASRTMKENGSTLAAIEIARDADGQINTIYRGTGSTLGLIDRTVYERSVATGQLMSIKSQDADGLIPWVYQPINELTYTYDAKGLVATESLNAQGPVVSATYAYDAANQVTDDGNQSYDYDALGNRTTHTTGTFNRLTYDGSQYYHYDAEGNLTKRGVSRNFWYFTYDDANRLIKAERRADSNEPIEESVEYKYDGLGRRLERTYDADGQGTGEAETEKYGYLGENAVADLDSKGVVARRLYLDGADQLVARVAGAGAEWYFTDRLGSVRRIERDSGNLSQNAIDYTAFGVTTGTPGTLIDRYRYTGREWEPAFEAYYYRARFYSPDAGRFFSEDPLRYAAGDINLYRYVGNNATNATDPSGLQEDQPANDRQSFGERMRGSVRKFTGAFQSDEFKRDVGIALSIQSLATQVALNKAHQLVDRAVASETGQSLKRELDRVNRDADEALSEWWNDVKKDFKADPDSLEELKEAAEKVVTENPPETVEAPFQEFDGPEFNDTDSEPNWLRESMDSLGKVFGDFWQDQWSKPNSNPNSIGESGTVDGLTPLVGNARDAIHHFQNRRYLRAGWNGVMTLLDVFIFKSMAQGAARDALATISQSKGWRLLLEKARSVGIKAKVAPGSRLGMRFGPDDVGLPGFGNTLTEAEIQAFARTHIDSLPAVKGKFFGKYADIQFSDDLVRQLGSPGLTVKDGKFAIVFPKSVATPDFIVAEEVRHLMQAVERFGPRGAKQFEEMVRRSAGVNRLLLQHQDNPAVLAARLRAEPQLRAEFTEAFSFLQWEREAKTWSQQAVRNSYRADSKTWQQVREAVEYEWSGPNRYQERQAMIQRLLEEASR